MEMLTQKTEFASAKIGTQYPNDPLKNRTVRLIYDPSRSGSCGVDATEVCPNLKKGEIPIYLCNRAFEFLRADGQIGSAYQFAKVIIKLDR